MSRFRFILPLLATVGCVPNGSEVTSGSFVAFLADGTSPSLATGAIDPSDEEWSFNYNVDCREFESPADRQTFQLPMPINICDDPDVWPPEHEQWADRSAFQVVGQELQSYRGDAIANNEGDVQFAFHHRLPNGEDFRWVFSLDPDFQPTRCVSDGDDGVIREDLDGDWIEQWSRELRRLDGDIPAGLEHLEGLTSNGDLYFINARGYQIDPLFESTATNDDRWFLPQQWRAAAATGRFAEDLIEERSARYGEPALYESYENVEPGFDRANFINEDDLWLCDDGELAAGADPTSNICMMELGDRMALVEDEVSQEISLLTSGGRPADEPLFTFRPIVHLNDWREPDGLAPGLDGWGEIHYSFVVLDPSSELEVGGQASGAFQLFFEGIGSISRVMIKGTFQTDRIRSDRWGAQDLFADKAEENEVELCFEQ